MRASSFANLLLEFGELEGARSAYETALEIQPRQVETLVNLALACKRLGDRVAARGPHTALERVPDHVRASTPHRAVGSPTGVELAVAPLAVSSPPRALN